MYEDQHPALVIMAAGMGSRFGGMKQLTPRWGRRGIYHRLFHIRRLIGRFQPGGLYHQAGE